MLTEALAVLLLVAGAFFIVTAVIGVLRLPDFYTRLHAVGKCETAGLALSLLGLAVLAHDPEVTVKLILVVLFVGLANPTATHALARAARQSGLPMWKTREPREEP
jgi:multicomponent Na+:H+ antiporter subunit G